MDLFPQYLEWRGEKKKKAPTRGYPTTEKKLGPLSQPAVIHLTVPFIDTKSVRVIHIPANHNSHPYVFWSLEI